MLIDANGVLLVDVLLVDNNVIIVFHGYIVVKNGR